MSPRKKREDGADEDEQQEGQPEEGRPEEGQPGTGVLDTANANTLTGTLETPLESGVRHIERALDSIAQGMRTTLAMNPEETAACKEWAKGLPADDHRRDTIDALLAAREVQAG